MLPVILFFLLGLVAGFIASVMMTLPLKTWKIVAMSVTLLIVIVAFNAAIPDPAFTGGTISMVALGFQTSLLTKNNKARKNANDLLAIEGSQQQDGSTYDVSNPASANQNADKTKVLDSENSANDESDKPSASNIDDLIDLSVKRRQFLRRLEPNKWFNLQDAISLKADEAFEIVQDWDGFINWNTKNQVAGVEKFLLICSDARGYHWLLDVALKHSSRGLRKACIKTLVSLDDFRLVDLISYWNEGDSDVRANVIRICCFRQSNYTEEDAPLLQKFADTIYSEMPVTAKKAERSRMDKILGDRYPYLECPCGGRVEQNLGCTKCGRNKWGLPNDISVDDAVDNLRGISEALLNSSLG